MIASLLFSSSLVFGKILPFAQWPLLVMQNQVYVKVKLQSGKQATLMLDTGSPQTFVSAKALDQPPTIETKDHLFLFTANGFGLAAQGLQMAAKDDKNTFADGKGLLGDGILGLGAFKGMRIGIDFAGAQLSFYSSNAPIEEILSSYFPEKKYFFSDEGGYYLPPIPVKVNGFLKDLIPDTGATVSALPPNQALSELPKTSKTLRFKNWDVSRKTKSYSGLTMEFAGSVHKNRTMLLFKESPVQLGLLGLHELTNLRLLWDGVEKRLYYAEAGGDLPQSPQRLYRQNLRTPYLADANSSEVLQAPAGIRVHVPSTIVASLSNGYKFESDYSGGQDLIPAYISDSTNFKSKASNTPAESPLTVDDGKISIAKFATDIVLFELQQVGSYPDNYKWFQPSHGPVIAGPSQEYPFGFSLKNEAFPPPLLITSNSVRVLVKVNGGDVVIPKTWKVEPGDWMEKTLASGYKELMKTGPDYSEAEIPTVYDSKGNMFSPDNVATAIIVEADCAYQAANWTVVHLLNDRVELIAPKSLSNRS